MKDDILKAIEANLPTLAAGELKKFLQQAEIDKVNLANSIKANEDYVKEIEKFRKENREIKEENVAYKMVNDGVIAKIKDIEQREKEVYIKEMNLEIKSEQKVSEVYKNIMNLMLGNVVIKEKITKNIPLKSGGYMGYGNNGQQIPLDGSENITTVEDIKTTTKE